MKRGWLLAILLLVPAVALCENNSTSPTIQEVKAKHEARLLALPGVVSVGIGRDEDGRPAIIVGLDRPRPETEAQLPPSLEGYPMSVQVIGPIKAQ
jgi:hypothetical protein